MPNINDIYHGTSLKAEDLKGQEVTVTIESVEVAEFDEGERMIIHFAETDRTFILNKTNARTIAALYGDESDFWKGCQITLMPTQTDYKGSQVPCIRVKLQAVPKGPQSESVPPAAAQPGATPF